MPKGYDMARLETNRRWGAKWDSHDREWVCSICDGTDMIHVMGTRRPVGCVECQEDMEYRALHGKNPFEQRLFPRSAYVKANLGDGSVCWDNPKPKVEVQPVKDFRKDMRLVYFVDDAANARALIAPDLKRLEKARKRAERNPRQPATDLIDWLARPLNDMVKGIENAFLGLGRACRWENGSLGLVAPLAFVAVCVVMFVVAMGSLNDNEHRRDAAATAVCKRSNALHRSQAQNWEDTARMLRNEGRGDKAELMEWSAVEQRESIMDCENLTNR